MPARLQPVARVVVSSASSQHAMVRLLDECTDAWAAAIEFVVESDAELASTLSENSNERTRYARPDRVPTQVRSAAAKTGTWIADQPVLAAGRIELLWYLREQSISHAYHRYGNLGSRANEERAHPR